MQFETPNGNASPIWTVAATNNDDEQHTWLYVYNGDGDVVARQRFATYAVDGAPAAGPQVPYWLLAIVDGLLNDDGRGRCADCGNVYDDARPFNGHAPDCDYRDCDRCG